MKKLVNNKIFYFIIGAVLFSGVTVFAYSLNSSDISYIPTDENFGVNNAQEAIDKLYELSQDNGVEIIDLGTEATIDVSSYEGYENFTADNFIVGIVSFKASVGTSGGYENGSLSKAIAKSYDAETGILTISNLSGHAGLSTGNMTASVSINTYLVY